jgi:hypothetical protein
MKWLIGLAAGAAVVYFLQTEKGKEFMESVQKEAGSIGDCIADLAGDLFKKGSTAAGDAADTVKNAVA